MAFSTLAIDLTAKVAGFEEGMNKAVKSLDRVDKRAAAMSSSLKAAFGVAVRHDNGTPVTRNG